MGGLGFRDGVMKGKTQSSPYPMSRYLWVIIIRQSIRIGSALKYTACLTASHYSGRYLALENFSCLSNKSIALALFAIVTAILVSKMKFSSVITPNAYNGFV
jgi:hypothetical protein